MIIISNYFIKGKIIQKLYQKHQTKSLKSVKTFIDLNATIILNKVTQILIFYVQFHVIVGKQQKLISKLYIRWIPLFETPNNLLKFNKKSQIKPNSMLKNSIFSIAYLFKAYIISHKKAQQVIIRYINYNQYFVKQYIFIRFQQVEQEMQKASSTKSYNVPYHLADIVLLKGVQTDNSPKNTCNKCSFVTYMDKCLFCEPRCAKQLDMVDQKDYKTVTNLDEKDNKTLYIFCLDNSGSVQVTYNVQEQDQYEPIKQLQKLKEKLSNSDFQKMIKGLTKDQILKSQTMILELLEAGINIQEIVSDIGNKNVTKQTKQKNRSRKNIMKAVVVQLLNQMKNKKCDVIITFFNDKICSQGIEDTHLLFMEDEEKSAFQCGRKAAKNIKKYQKNQYDYIPQLFKKFQAQNGTALGPALVFCSGIAAASKYSQTQIILITDGTSNTGFGEMQSIKRQQNSEAAYIAQQTYSNIATKYMIPNNIIVNLMAFQDSEIKYYIIEKFMQMIGGYPVQLQIKSQKKNNTHHLTLTRSAYSNGKQKFKLNVIQKTKKEIWNTRIAIICSNPNITIENQRYEVKGKGIILVRCGVLNEKQTFNIKLHSDTDFQKIPEFSLKVIIQCQFQGKEIRMVSTQKLDLRPAQCFQKAIEQNKNLRSSESQNADKQDSSAPKKIYGSSKCQNPYKQDYESQEVQLTIPSKFISQEKKQQKKNTISYKNDTVSMRLRNDFYDDDSDD